MSSELACDNCNGEIEQQEEWPVVHIRSSQQFFREFLRARTHQRPFIAVWDNREKIEVWPDTAEWRFTHEGLKALSQMFQEAMKRRRVRKASLGASPSFATLKHLPIEWTLERLQSIVTNPAYVESSEDPAFASWFRGSRDEAKKAAPIVDDPSPRNELK